MTHRSITKRVTWTASRTANPLRQNQNRAGPIERRKIAHPLIAASYLLVAMLVLAGCGVSAANVNTPAKTASSANQATPAGNANTPAQGSSSGNGSAPIASRVPSSPTPTTSTAGSATPKSSSTLPNFDHIYVIMMENKESTEIIGSDRAPYLNSLIGQYGVATSYTGVSHPSQPNYLALWAGSTFGITDDNNHDLTGPTIADQLDAAGKSWRVFAENYPVGAAGAAPACFTKATARGGEDGPGNYSRKHNPAMSFTSLSTDLTRCSQHITDFTHFDAAAANFSFVVPNACHDMHDCAVSDGDKWLQQWLPEHILNTPTWKNSNSAIFITWDEGETAKGGGGNVPLIVISHETAAGFVSQAPFNHYSLLLTIERAWGLGCLSSSCTAEDLSAFFR